jgi:hypothetical protein
MRAGFNDQPSNKDWDIVILWQATLKEIINALLSTTPATTPTLE